MSSTWLKEAYGLFDFDQKNDQKTHQLIRLQGNNYLMQNPQYTRIDNHWLNNDSFETADVKVPSERILVRVLNKNNDYWVYHKNLVDEAQE